MLGKLDSIERLHAAASFTNLVEVFVDDFCAMTNNLTRSHLEKFSRAMLLGIHSVFPPPEISGHTGEDPVAQKKMLAGDGQWEHTKEMLGWIVNGAEYTIQLPPEKCHKILAQIKQVTRMNACPLNTYQKLAGKLQHASYGISGGKGLFSPIWSAMAANPPFIRITPELKQTLFDWRVVIQKLADAPTHITLLVPKSPSYLQYTDACGLGAGGVICPGSEDID